MDKIEIVRRDFNLLYSRILGKSYADLAGEFGLTEIYVEKRLNSMIFRARRMKNLDVARLEFDAYKKAELVRIKAELAPLRSELNRGLKIVRDQMKKLEKVFRNSQV